MKPQKRNSNVLRVLRCGAKAFICKFYNKYGGIWFIRNFASPNLSWKQDIQGFSDANIMLYRCTAKQDFNVIK